MKDLCSARMPRLAGNEISHMPTAAHNFTVRPNLPGCSPGCTAAKITASMQAQIVPSTTISLQATPKLLVTYSFFTYNAMDSCPLALMHKVRLTLQFLGVRVAKREALKAVQETLDSLHGAFKHSVTVLIKALNYLYVSVITTLPLLHLQGSKSTGKTVQSKEVPGGAKCSLQPER